jgi:pilus assembly protein CpaF
VAPELDQQRLSACHRRTRTSSTIPLADPSSRGYSSRLVKTTLLAAALAAVSGDERIVCVEDAAELAPRHPHLVRLVARSANVEGVGEITLRQLVRQALRMRPDRIVVGEVRGAEVIDLLAALNTGHDGGAGTVHANTRPRSPPASRRSPRSGVWTAALHSQLAVAVQVLMHVSRGRDGRRRLSEIAVLRRDNNGRVHAVTAWHADRGFNAGAEQLRTLIAARRGG